MADLLSRVTQYMHRRWYPQGRVLSQTLATDVRREIEIVSNERIHEGLLTVRVRVYTGTESQNQVPEYGEPVEMPIAELWNGSPAADKDEA